MFLLDFFDINICIAFVANDLWVVVFMMRFGMVFRFLDLSYLCTRNSR